MFWQLNPSFVVWPLGVSLFGGIIAITAAKELRLLWQNATGTASRVQKKKTHCHHHVRSQVCKKSGFETKKSGFETKRPSGLGNLCSTYPRKEQPKKQSGVKWVRCPFATSPYMRVLTLARWGVCCQDVRISNESNLGFTLVSVKGPQEPEDFSVSYNHGTYM